MGIFSNYKRQGESRWKRGTKTSGKFRHCLNILGFQTLVCCEVASFIEPSQFGMNISTQKLLKCFSLSDGLEILGQFSDRDATIFIVGVYHTHRVVSSLRFIYSYEMILCPSLHYSNSSLTLPRCGPSVGSKKTARAATHLKVRTWHRAWTWKLSFLFKVQMPS